MSNSKKQPKKRFKGKVVMIGDSGVGKTSILLRHDGQGFTSCMSTTLSASFLTSKIRTKGGEVELNIWDTAGQERFRSMLPMYIRNAAAAIFVYDITRYDSFQNMSFWFDELARHIPNKVFKYIMANKCDLQSARVVSETEGRDYAALHDATYFETSALNGRGIDMGMLSIAESLVDYHLLSADDSHLNLSTVNGSDAGTDCEKEKTGRKFCCTIS